MLLEPQTWSLAESSDTVLPRLSSQLSTHVAPETHAAVVEIVTGVHPHVDEVVAELGLLRRRLAGELAEMGLSVAAAGTHPTSALRETEVSGAARYRLLGESLRGLARRQPTMSLHVHVGVPTPEDAVRVLNGLREHLPVLLALSANSPFCDGRDGGFDSLRTVIFQAFPRTGAPRTFAGYADYIEAVDALVAPGAIPDPSFLWWDARLQPALGTVEVRVMDAQSSVRDVAPLVALVQALAHLALEGDGRSAGADDQVLAENRFLAARDGMAARLIDSRTRRLIPIRETLQELLASCRPHALALRCEGKLERVRSLAAANGAKRQRAFSGGLGGLVERLAQQFLSGTRTLAAEGATAVSLASAAERSGTT